MRIKTTLRYHFTLTRVSPKTKTKATKKTGNNLNPKFKDFKCGGDVDTSEDFYTAGGNIEW